MMDETENMQVEREEEVEDIEEEEEDEEDLERQKEKEKEALVNEGPNGLLQVWAETMLFGRPRQRSDVTKVGTAFSISGVLLSHTLCMRNRLSYCAGMQLHVELGYTHPILCRPFEHK